MPSTNSRTLGIALTGAFEKEVVRLAVNLVGDLQSNDANRVPITPVDTGWLRRNWHIEVGSSSSNPHPHPDPRGEQTYPVLPTPVFAYRFENGRVFVQNNVPYAAVRNKRGALRQAPDWFQRQTMITVERERRRREEL